MLRLSFLILVLFSKLSFATPSYSLHCDTMNGILPMEVEGEFWGINRVEGYVSIKIWQNGQIAAQWINVPFYATFDDELDYRLLTGAPANRRHQIVYIQFNDVEVMASAIKLADGSQWATNCLNGIQEL